MPRFTLNSAAFHGFRFTTGPKRGEGGPVVIAEFSAPWTETNRKTGGWEELPDCVSGEIRLVPGKLAASHIEFKPGKGLEKHAVSLDVSSAEDFKCFAPTKEGQARELRFVVKTSVKNAEREFGDLGRTVGNAGGRLSISYDEAEQERLISEEAAEATSEDED